ncbi:MAG TPA: hypothetical protein VIK23_04475 [Acetobacterium sp.]
MMKHTELRCACESSVTKIPDVHNFWDGPDVCAHAVFYLTKNRDATNGDDPVTTPVNPLYARSSDRLTPVRPEAHNWM